MKSLKLFILFICLLFSTLAIAQGYIDKGSVMSSSNYEIDVKKVQFQVRAGLNISTQRVTIDGEAGTEESKVGYNFGGIADISLGKSFYFQTGLFFTAKGSQMRQMDVGGRTVDMTMNSLYLQVPIYFAYKMPVGGWPNSFNIAMGPYVAYGVGGKVSGGGYSADTFGDKGLANRPDIGLGMELQFEMPKVVFFYGFEAGFAETIKREYIGLKVNNSNFYFGMGYKF